ncbi:MAG: dephospho-CoA kinase [Pelagibacterales bacterium]|nr:dephospho-CoA kinase [Pelagibacterales bacterium]
MKIIGLTGGVASGKNFIADIFAKHGAAIFDADQEVHNLLKNDQITISEIKKHFPESFINNEIDRKILGKIVFSNKEKLKILEDIIHEKVRKAYDYFLKSVKKLGKKIIVLNIPLLLETKSYKCDKIIAISISKIAQKQRFLSRNKMQNLEDSTIRFYQIYSRQISKKEES